jgi:hypothetical protein
MFNSPWFRRGLWSAAVVGIIVAGWYGWFRVDWYDFYPAVPPDDAGKIVDDPRTQLLKLTLNDSDPTENQPTVTAGEYFEIAGRLKLDPEYWAIPMTMAQIHSLPPKELDRIQAKEAEKVRCVVLMSFIRKSWLSSGEKQVKHLLGTAVRSGKQEIRWTARGFLAYPGVYLVRISVGERQPFLRLDEGFPKISNQRILRTFLLTRIIRLFSNKNASESV